MALPTDTFTAADLAVAIPEVWGDRVNDFYRAKLVMADFFMDRSSELTGGGDILHTPNITQMSANAKANATAVTLNSPTETSIDLTVDQWFEVSFMIEDKELMQVNQVYNLVDVYARNAGYTAGNHLEGAIAALFSGFTANAGTTATALNDAAVLSAISTYTTNDAPLDEASWFLHPKTVWSDLMVIDKFSLISRTSASDPVTKGAIGMLYGVPVFQTTNVTDDATDYSGVLASNDAIHWAANTMPGSSGAVRVQSDYLQEYLATLVTADILYGVIENRDNAGVEIISAV